MWPEYFLFLLKTVTLVIAVIFVAAAVISTAVQARIAQAGEARPKPLRIRRLNDEVESRSKQLRRAIEKPAGVVRGGLRGAWDRLRARLPGRDEGKSSSGKKEASPDRPDTGEDSGTSTEAPRHYVLRFTGDIHASAVDALREEISAVLQIARPGIDRVLLVLDSPGGVVPGYGLAAAQLARLRTAEVELVVVDQVAASGGYMMAAVADHIVAAPFAIVGSIGVVAQLPNIHRLLKHNNIDIELHTAGQYKRTLTLLGENTEAGREKFREELEQTHELFKRYLARYRPSLDLERLATGEHWYGEDALERGLIDALGTSDDLILEAIKAGDTFEIVQPTKKRGLLARVSASVQTALSEWRQPL